MRRVSFLPTLCGYGLLLAAAVAGNRALAVGGLATALASEWVIGHLGPEIRAPVSAGGRLARVLAASVLSATALGTITSGSVVALVSYALGVLAIHAGVGAYRYELLSLIRHEPPMGVRNIGERPPVGAVFVKARRWLARGTLVLISLDLPLLAGVLLAGESRTAAVPSAAIAGAVGIVVLSLASWRRRFLARGHIEHYVARLIDEVTAYDPDAVFHVPSREWIYTVNQWVPVVNASGGRVVFVCRSLDAAKSLDTTALPVVAAQSKRDLESIVGPQRRVALHAVQSPSIKDFFEDANRINVWLSHGDSDKSYNAQPLARVYDEIWVAGEAAIDRYDAAGIGIPRERFRIIGRAQLEGIDVGPLETDPPTVLYAPTYEGPYEHANYSSVVTSGEEMIEAIIRARPEIGITFKPHPMTGHIDPAYGDARERIKALLRAAPNAQLHVVAEDAKNPDLVDYFNRAHVLIADISSVISDFLHSERPVIVTNPKRLPLDEFLARFPTQRGSYICGPDGQEVVDAIEAAFGSDPLCEKRREMKNYTLGDPPGGPLEAFRRALHDANRRTNIDSADAPLVGDRGIPVS